MAYCTVDDVVTLTGGAVNEDAAEALIEAASDFVDSYTGRTWVAGAVTGEVHPVLGGQITLDRYPITTITTMTIVSPWIGATPRTLAAGSGYAILDATRGLVLVSGSDDDRVTVAYTPSLGTVPDDIKAATAMLVAYWSRSATDSTWMIYEKIKAGTAELVYRQQSGVETLPTDVKIILDGYRSSFVMV